VENSLGITFDPDELVAKFRAGVPVAHLKQFGSLRMPSTRTMTESVASK